MERNSDQEVFDFIKKMRVEKNMSLKEFSEFSGFSVYQLRKIEAGTFTLRAIHIFRFAKRLNISVSNFYKIYFNE